MSLSAEHKARISTSGDAKKVRQKQPPQQIMSRHIALAEPHNHFVEYGEWLLLPLSGQISREA